MAGAHFMMPVKASNFMLHEWSLLNKDELNTLKHQLVNFRFSIDENLQKIAKFTFQDDAEGRVMNILTSKIRKHTSLIQVSVLDFHGNPASFINLNSCDLGNINYELSYSLSSSLSEHIITFKVDKVDRTVD